MALKAMRQYTKVIMWAIVILGSGGLVSIGGWSYSRSMRNPDSRNVAIIDDTGISYDTFARVYKNYRDFYQQIQGSSYNDRAVVLAALDKVITDEILIREARRRGFKVADAEVQMEIASNPAFQRNGRFDRELYFRLLAYNRIDPTTYESDLRKSILIGKLVDSVRNQARVTEGEVREEYIRENEKVKLKYAVITPQSVKDKINITEEELQKFYEDNKESRFKTSETVNVKHALISLEKSKGEVDVTPKDVDEYYEKHRDEFERPGTIRVSHILIKTENRSDEEAKAKAEEILRKIREGADFAEMAKKYSEDSSASKGGDLGYFGRGTMVAPFEEAAFALEPGGMSGIVKTQFGYHIIKRHDPKAEAKEQLIQERADELAKKRAQELLEKVREKPEDFETLAKSYGTEVLETGYFSRGEIIENVGDIYEVEFTQTAFGLEKPGQVAEKVAKTKRGYEVISLIGKKAPYIQPLSEVRERAKGLLLNEKSWDFIKEEGDGILKKIESGTPFEKALAERKLNPTESDLFSRATANQPIQVVKRAFELKEGESGTVSAGSGVYVFKVVKKEEFDPKKYEEKREEIYNRLLLKRQQDMYNDWLTYLKGRAKIWRNEELLGLTR
ncbi:MAG: peptidylprolyl isomerase [bacterium]